MLTIYGGGSRRINWLVLAFQPGERHSRGMLIALTLATVVPVIPAVRTFRCTPTRVWDGDGPLW